MANDKTLIRRAYELKVTLLTTGAQKAALTVLKELAMGVVEEVEAYGSFEGAGTSCISDDMNEDSFSTQIEERVMGDWNVLIYNDGSSIDHDAYRCIGSISHGTLRAEDLIPLYMSALHDVCPDAYTINLQTWFDQTAEGGVEFWMGAGNSEWVSSLFEELSHHTDDLHTYLVFGAHPDDGADIGYWVDYDAVADAIEAHELMSFASLEDAELFYTGTHREHINPRFVITQGDGYYESMHDAESGLTLWNHNS